jgi:hypothetical protein
MTKYTTVFASLLRHLSRSEFESAASGYRGDFRIRVLGCWDLFKSMLYAHISNCFSVREIEASMRANGNRLYHAGLKQIKRSTFCDALEKRRNGIYKSVFHLLADKAQGISGRTKKRFKEPLRILDATIISVCLKKFNWAKYRKAKGAVKLHLNLDGNIHIPFDAYLSNGKVHDVKMMKNLTEETGVIYAMDRGYVDYKSLHSIELQGSFFVTRMKRNGAFKRIHNNTHKEGGPILSDVLIELTGVAAKKAYPKPLRKIRYKDKETEKVYEFLTNDMGRDAQEIAAIYKERWEVELFFKWIKQHLKIKSFWGTSTNAVYSQIWVALILTILLWINRTLDGITVSPYELMIRMKSALLTKTSLTGLCTNITVPKLPDYSLQPFLEGFKC